MYYSIKAAKPQVRLHEVQHRWASAHIVCAKHHIICAKHNLVLCPPRRNDVSLRLNDVASKLANDVVSYGHKHKKKDTIFIVSFFLGPTLKMEPVLKPDFLKNHIRSKNKTNFLLCVPNGIHPYYQLNTNICYCCLRPV